MWIAVETRRWTVPVVVREEEVEMLNAQRRDGIKHLERIVVEIDDCEESIRLPWESILETADSPYGRIIGRVVTMIYAAAVIGRPAAVDAHANAESMTAQDLDERFIDERSVRLDDEGDFEVIPSNAADERRIVIKPRGSEE